MQCLHILEKLKYNMSRYLKENMHIKFYKILHQIMAIGICTILIPAEEKACSLLFKVLIINSRNKSINRIITINSMLLEIFNVVFVLLYIIPQALAFAYAKNSNSNQDYKGACRLKHSNSREAVNILLFFPFQHSSCAS